MSIPNEIKLKEELESEVVEGVEFIADIRKALKEYNINYTNKPSFSDFIYDGKISLNHIINKKVVNSEDYLELPFVILDNHIFYPTGQKTLKQILTDDLSEYNIIAGIIIVNKEIEDITVLTS